MAQLPKPPHQDPVSWEGSLGPYPLPVLSSSVVVHVWGDDCDGRMSVTVGVCVCVCVD